jgi:hypothetical protein
MNPVQRRIAGVFCATALAALAPEAGAVRNSGRDVRSTAPTPVIGRAIVVERGFDVMYWDSVNGLRNIGPGLEPAISANGLFVTYIGRDGEGCNPVRVYDVRARRNVDLPGLNTGDCNDNPALSGDGRFVGYETRSTDPGDPSAINLYDIVNQQKIELAEPVQSSSTEESPTLNTDGSLLTFVSGRNGPAFDDIFMADISNPAAPTLISLPGLNSDESDRDAYMSDDGSTIAFVRGPLLGDREVSVYDVATGTVVTPTALSDAYDIWDAALNRDGSIVAVARRAVDLGDTAVALFDRTSETLTIPSFLKSDLSDENPGIADGVELIDDTPPKVKLRCKSPKEDTIRCKVGVSEAARVKLSARLDGEKTTVSRRFAAPGRKRLTLEFDQDVRGRAKVVAKAVDNAGLKGKKKKRVRVR